MGCLLTHSVSVSWFTGLLSTFPYTFTRYVRGPRTLTVQPRSHLTPSPPLCFITNPFCLGKKCMTCANLSACFNFWTSCFSLSQTRFCEKQLGFELTSQQQFCQSFPCSRLWSTSVTEKKIVDAVLQIHVANFSFLQSRFHIFYWALCGSIKSWAICRTVVFVPLFFRNVWNSADTNWGLLSDTTTLGQTRRPVGWEEEGERRRNCSGGLGGGVIWGALPEIHSK